MDIAREEITEELDVEIGPLLEKHTAEMVEGYKLDYSIKYYMSMQVEGMYDFYVGRVEGKIVCYAGYYFSPSPHHVSEIYAVCDLVYVLPEYRGKYALQKLMEFAEDDFRRRSIKRTTMSCRVEHDFSPILKRSGYKLTETIYTKEL